MSSLGALLVALDVGHHDHVAVERQDRGPRRRGDAGMLPDAREDLVVEDARARGTSYRATPRLTVAVATPCVREAEGHLQRVDEASEEQPGADEQHETQRHLRGDQRRAQAAARATWRVLPRESIRARRARDARHAGARPKSTPVPQATSAVKIERRAIQARGEPGDLDAARQLEARDQPSASAGHIEAEAAAGDRQHQALDQQLTRDPAAAGADRHAHGDLAAPRRAARELQVGQVGAADEQRDRDDRRRAARRSV